MDLNRIFERLWIDHAKQNPSADKIFESTNPYKK